MLNALTPKPKGMTFATGWRKFTPEFRANVVKLCESPAESVARVCRRFDLSSSVVRIYYEDDDQSFRSRKGDLDQHNEKAYRPIPNYLRITTD